MSMRAVGGTARGHVRELVSLTILLADFLGAVEEGGVDRAVIRLRA